MQIVNLCSHPINIYDDFPQRGGSCVLTLPACHPAEEARTVRQDRAEKIADHPAGFVLVYGGVQKTINVPAPREGVCYVVSAHVACHHPERFDLLVPGHTVKVGGVRVGCLGLSYFNDPRVAAPKTGDSFDLPGGSIAVYLSGHGPDASRFTAEEVAQATALLDARRAAV